MNVLFIASYAECPRVWNMASTLAKKKFNVTILEWDRNAKLPVNAIANNIAIQRMKLKAPYGTMSALFFPIWWLYVVLFVLKKSFDVLQPQNLDNLFFVWLIAKIKEAKIVYDIADFYSEGSIPPKMVKLKKIIANIEKTLIQNVQIAIIVDKVRLRQIALPSTNFNIIYNSPPDMFEEFKSNRSVEHHDYAFVLFYAGILTRDRGLDIIVSAIRDMDDVQFVVAGFGYLEKEFSVLIEGKKNIKFLGLISYEDVLKWTYLSDCVIALYDPAGPNNVYASPNKLFESMMCGKPIIVSDGTAMADMVRQEKCGVIIKYGNVAELKEEISRMKKNADLLGKLGENGRRAYIKKYSWAIMEKRLLDIYANLEK